MRYHQAINSVRNFTRYHALTLTRAGVLVGLVCMLPVIGYLVTSPRLNPFFILVALVMPVGAFAILRQIELGFVGMLLAGVFVRVRLPTGTSSEIVVSLLLCMGVMGIWVVRMLVEEKRLTLKPIPVNFPLLAFIAVIFISLVWGRVYRDVFVHDIGSPFVAVASAVVMAFLPATLILVANLVKDMRWLQAMVYVFLVEGLVSLLVSLVMDLGIGPADTIRRIVFHNGVLWINTQGLYSMWYLSFALSFALFHRNLHWAVRAALFAYVAGWVLWGFWLRTSWLSGWVPTFAAAGVIAFLRSKKLFLIAMLVIVVGAGGYYWRTSFQAESEESGGTRLAAYEVNWRVTGKHLLFGTGPAGYAAYYMSYFPMEGMASHSNYIDIIAQTGIVGSVFILWFFGVQAWGGYKIWRKFQHRGDFGESMTAAVVGGTAGCIIAMALGDWLFPFAYTQSITGYDAAMFNWFFMGTVWALSRIMTSESTETSGLYPAEEMTA
ncbi:MAG: O-antigen ligase family protein [Chloroflexi bacterium]|nr:O-antigen ligase family protein [Chloroflexota bacterium]